MKSNFNKAIVMAFANTLLVYTVIIYLYIHPCSLHCEIFKGTRPSILLGTWHIVHSW